MDIYKEERFGTVERIKEWFYEKKKTESMTLKDFSDRVDVNIRSVSRWFNDENPTKISHRHLADIAEVMNCDIEYLECKQNYPRRSMDHKNKLSPVSLVDKYLPKVRDLMSTTKQRFNYEYDPELIAHGEEIDGYFIEGETKYHYKDHVFENEVSEIFYRVSVNGSEPIRLSEATLEAFIKRVMRTISKEVEDLKEVKEMYPNITKEMNRANMTVEELARALGTDPEIMADKLRGNRDIILSESVKIKNAIGSELPLEVLFDTETN